MSRTTWLTVAAGWAGLAAGCYSPCGSSRCSLMSRRPSAPTATMAAAPDCGQPAGPVYYGDPTPIGIPTGNGPRPDNELPMPNQNITPPANPIPVGIPAVMPGKGK